MSTKRSSNISISKLARFAASPDEFGSENNAAAIKYGNKAHRDIGKGPNPIVYIAAAAGIILLAIGVYTGALL